MQQLLPQKLIQCTMLIIYISIVSCGIVSLTLVWYFYAMLCYICKKKLYDIVYYCIKMVCFAIKNCGDSPPFTETFP